MGAVLERAAWPLFSCGGFTNTKENLMKLFRKLFALTTILALLVAVPACNTMEGAGKDIKKGGEKLEDAAD